MRGLLLVLIVSAAACAARAEPSSCRHSILHPTACRSGDTPAAAPAPPPPPAAAAASSAPAPQPTAERPIAPSPAASPPKPTPAQHTAARVAATPPTEIVDPRLVEPYACNFAEKMTLGASVCSARQIAQSRRIAGSLVHEGRCDQAVRTARETGDEDYAARIRAFCVDRMH